MKKSIDQRRAEAIRNNRFGMLSWDPSELFEQCMEHQLWYGMEVSTTDHLRELCDRMACGNERWAKNKLLSCDAMIRYYESTARRYLKYAQLVLVARAKLTISERNEVDGKNLNRVVTHDCSRNRR